MMKRKKRRDIEKMTLCDLQWVKKGSSLFININSAEIINEQI